MLRKNIFLTVLLLLALLLAGCHHGPTEADVSGKTYVYEKEGFGGDFTITVKEDGTFYYCVGPLSSYIGLGTWTLDDGILTLFDDGGPTTCIYRFQVDGNDLIFIAEGSNNFIYLKIEDGARFSAPSKQ